jgi:hypothetical protein
MVYGGPTPMEMDPVTASCRLRKALTSAAEWPDCMKNLIFKGQCHPPALGAGALQVPIDIRPFFRGTWLHRLFSAPVNRRL